MLAKRGWLLLFLAIVVFYLWGLGAFPLVGPDEPRYAEVAREMLTRHDLITPTLGGLPWFEKPALLYWSMMAAYRLLGVSEYTARLGPAICGLLTAVFVYWIGKTVESSQAAPSLTDSVETVQRRDGLGRFSALVWLSSVGAIVFSRGASFDIVVTMTITGALACFLCWHIRYAGSAGEETGTTKPALLFGFYFFVGLSLLAKGLIGIVIPFGVIATFWLLKREWPSRRFLQSLLWGGPLAIAVAALWFGPMLSRHGWHFIDQFIIQHHFARFVSNKYHHPAPFYFYVLVLIGLALPWTIFLGASLFASRRWRWRGRMPLDDLQVFAFAWILVPMVFFSFSESKLTAYILPVLPAVALLIGERITCFQRAQRGDLVLRLTGVLLIGLGAAGGWYLVHHTLLTRFSIGLNVLPLILIGLSALVQPQWRRSLLILIPIAVLVSSVIGLSRAAPGVARPESVRDLLAMATARGYGSARVVQLHTIERTAEFYAAGRVTYRTDGEPMKFEGVAQVIEAARHDNGPVLCLVPTEYESQLTSLPGIEAVVLAGNGRVSLVAVRVR